MPAAVLLAAWPAVADVLVGMTMQHDSYILGEPVRCTLAVENRGPSPLIIDDYGVYRLNRIDFEIRRQPNRAVRPFDPDAVFERLMLMPSDRQGLSVNLSSHYPLAREGRYFVRGVMQVDNVRYLTSLRMFDIVAGLELERTVMPVPGKSDVRRTYRLVYWAREQAEYLFLRASDAPGDRILETVPLGAVVRSTPPALHVSPDGLITVQHQASRDLHVRTVLESLPNGLRRIEQSTTEDHGTTPLRRALQRERERRESTTD